MKNSNALRLKLRRKTTISTTQFNRAKQVRDSLVFQNNTDVVARSYFRKGIGAGLLENCIEAIEFGGHLVKVFGADLERVRTSL